jgi:hypothetical protein
MAPIEEEAAPAGVRRSTRFATVLPLLLLSLCAPVMAQKVSDDYLERNGVYFQRMSQISFSESHWIMVSDFSLDRLSETLGRAQKWIQERESRGAGVGNLGLNTRVQGLARVAAKRLAVIKARETVLRESMGSISAARDIII